MAKEKMTLKTYSWDTSNGGLSRNPSSMEYEMPFSEQQTVTNPPVTFGMPCTVEAFHEMIKRYIIAASQDESMFSKMLCVTFSKASVFRILSQEGCEYVRIWQAIPDETGRVSMVLEGLDSNRLPVKMDKVLQTSNQQGTREHDPEDPNLEERGNGEDEEGGNPLVNFLKNKQLTEQGLSDFMADLFKALAK